MEPAGHLAPQAWMRLPETRAVVAALTADGGPVRFVGGCVRDAVLGRPIKDIDLATADPPAKVTELLLAAGLGAIPTGIEHGTVTAVAAGKPIEVTTLREDVEPLGRHANVAFTGDWVADAQRRDFTINALYCDPDGTLYDPAGGLADLKAGRVRFVGDAATRIREDYLRILRFFRIHAHYGTAAPDEEALAACRGEAAQLTRLSAERVAAELLRLLAAPAPAPAVALMAETGVLAQVLPEAVPQALPEAGNVERLAGLSRVDGADPDPLRRLAALVRTDSGGMSAERMAELARRLRLSRAQRTRLESLAELPPVSPDAEDEDLRRALYAVGREKFQDDVYLRWAEDADSKNPGWQRVLAFPDGWTPPSFPLSGEDAMAAGIEPGPAIGRALGEIEAWWIAEDFAPTRDECLARMAAAAMDD